MEKVPEVKVWTFSVEFQDFNGDRLVGQINISSRARLAAKDVEIGVVEDQA